MGHHAGAGEDAEPAPAVTALPFNPKRVMVLAWFVQRELWDVQP
jgi:hypothetical protein